MFGLDPEKIMRGLMGATGVSPEDFTGFIRTVMTEIMELRADRMAFRPASVKAYKDVTERLDRIEERVNRILAVLDPAAVTAIANQETDYERDTINGH
jgi:hypothetical protein